MLDMVITPSDFVAAVNQTLEYAYPGVVIEGELTNFRVSKNRWVYFDLKDEYASVKFFGTVYALPGPLEDGMLLRVTGQPQLSPRYGFSVTFRQISPVGEGSLVKAAQLLQNKLEKEGLFSQDRKRPLPYPPKTIGLITSRQSAAYADFMKILNSRWGGLQIKHADVQVQGEQAVSEIVRAFDMFNTTAETPDIVVLTRGGGSADDLAAFSTEQVTRAVAGSRAPTLVAVGHETDISLAELAADRRASTPSNAAELLVPDKNSELKQLKACEKSMRHALLAVLSDSKTELKRQTLQLAEATGHITRHARHVLESRAEILEQLNPDTVLKRGYALVSSQSGAAVLSVGKVEPGQAVTIRLHDGSFNAEVTEKNKVN